ncbi:MAG: methyltransferase domain-containing protein [Anaerorhabdus sp.]
MIYKEVAPFYHSLFYDKKAIEDWVTITTENIAGNNILECACGLGDVAAILKKRGKNIIASDQSEEMGKQVKKLYPNLEFIQMDMTNFTVEKCFDGIICYCDSINYLKNINELKLFLTQAYDHLNVNGKLIFDMHTMLRLEEFKLEYIEEGVVNDVDYLWSIIAKDKNLIHNFVFYTDSKTIYENHVQYVFSRDEVESCLVDVGFEFVVKTDFIYDGYQDGEKYFYICRKRKK